MCIVKYMLTDDEVKNIVSSLQKDGYGRRKIELWLPEHLVEFIYKASNMFLMDEHQFLAKLLEIYYNVWVASKVRKQTIDDLKRNS